MSFTSDVFMQFSIFRSPSFTLGLVSLRFFGYPSASSPAKCDIDINSFQLHTHLLLLYYHRHRVYNANPQMAFPWLATERARESEIKVPIKMSAIRVSSRK